MTTGEKIAALRRAQGWSQEALGEKLGLSRQAVSKWEADQAVPTMDNLMELSRLFGVSVDTLLRPGEELPGEDAKTDEQAETPAAPEPPKTWQERLHTMGRRQWIEVGAAALLCVSLICNIGLIQWSVRAQEDINWLTDQVNNMPATNTVYVPQPTDTDDGKNSDLVDSEVNVTLDPKNFDQIIVAMSALPREVSEKDTAKFVIRSGEENYTCGTWLDNGYGGHITMPMPEGRITVYLSLTAPDGSVRTLSLGEVYDVPSQFQMDLSAYWQGGGMSFSFGKTQAVGAVSVTIWNTSPDWKIAPEACRIALYHNGEEIKEHPMDLTHWELGLGFSESVSWRELEGTMSEYKVMVEVTDNYGRVFSTEVL